MSPCETCQSTTDVWTCAAGTFCRTHLPVKAGALWRSRPRPVDPDPYTRLDRLDGLPR